MIMKMNDFAFGQLNLYFHLFFKTLFFFTQEHGGMYCMFLSKFVSPHLGGEPWSPPFFGKEVVHFLLWEHPY